MDYKAAYFSLFNSMADAIEDLKNGKRDLALNRLILAQMNAEEEYINQRDGIGILFDAGKLRSAD